MYSLTKKSDVNNTIRNLIILLLIIFSIFGCSKNPLVYKFSGKWKNFLNDTIKFEIKEGHISSPLELIAKSKVKHKYKIKNDTLWHYMTCRKVPTLTSKGIVDKKVKIKSAIQINGDYVVSVSYKDL